MSNAAPQTGEPTMEEILASIRRIISEEETEPAKPAAPAADEPADLAVEEEDADVFDLTDIVEEPAPPPPEPPRRPSLAPIDDDISFEPDADFDAVPLSGLIADDVAARAGAAFDRLHRDMAVAHTAVGASLEGLIRELLKPLLKQWLDTYLEDIVERIVREEVERVASRRR